MADNAADQNGESGQTAAGVDEDAVRARAYEISQGPDAGTPEENWHRAMAELRSKEDAAT